MSSSQEVYTRIAEKLQSVHPNLHWRRLSNWIWIIVALIHGQSVHLSQLALHIPVGGEIPGRMARIGRWLANDAIEPRSLYDPLIREGQKQRHVQWGHDSCRRGPTCTEKSRSRLLSEPLSTPARLLVQRH